MATIESAKPALSAKIRDSFSPLEWRRLYGMFGFILFLHVLGIGILIFASVHHYAIGTTGKLGIGTGVLAYTLGMRHAFDADHIAAIDNTTRKFMSEGKRPMSVLSLIHISQ